MKLYNTETFELQEKKGKGENKFILKGNAMPLGETSRNGVYYRPESVKKNYNSLKGNSFLFAHQQNEVGHVLGHVTDVGITDSHVTYEVDVDPEEKDFIRKSKRGDINHVSVGVMINPDTVEIDEDNGTAYVDVDEFAELSSAPVPGYKNTSASLGQQVMALAEKMGDEEKVKKLKEKMKKEDNQEDNNSPASTSENKETEDSEKPDESGEKPDDSGEESESEVNESYQGSDKEEDEEPENKPNQSDDSNDSEDNQSESKEDEKESEDKSNEENDNEDGEKTTEEKVSDLNSQVQELQSNQEEIQNRMAAIESKVDQLLEGDESKNMTPETYEKYKKMKEQYENEKFEDDKEEKAKKPNIDSKKYQEQKESELGIDDKNEDNNKKSVDMNKQIKKNKKY